MSSVSPVRQLTNSSRSLESRVPSSSKSKIIHKVNTLEVYHLVLTTSSRTGIIVLTKYTKCIVGLNFQGSRVTECT